MNTQGQGGKDLLKAFWEKGFERDLSAASLVLGREQPELQQMLDGELEVDDDLEMKMRGIANERGIELNETGKA
ncbi:MAG: hypothetical protein QUS14_12170 [Pyrinomonadaceae bacterium]|nr:hypothetical protein [Pyrinomonadaceae bacterium]